MKNEIIKAFNTSIFNFNLDSNENFQCKLFSNTQEKMVSILRKYLQDCDEFIFSVAFITLGGLSLFLEEFKHLEEKNIKGKILTGCYLNFTEPKALKKLLTYKNINLKISNEQKFHPKAYLFRKNNIWTLIIGSSNLTQGALTTNFEWNLKITSLDDGKIVKSILDNFYNSFNSSDNLSIKKLEMYKKEYDKTKKVNSHFFENSFLKNEEIMPNTMQREALKNLKFLSREKNKALLISATGTGKTYLSAFAAKEYNAKKILFLAHRKTILEKSKESFKKIIKDAEVKIFDKVDIDNHQLKFDLNSESFKTSEIKSKNKKYIIFAMVQSLNKDKYLKNIPKDFFDYIIVDEVHHSAANTYQKILNYFKPKFLLGLTATPERTDNFNIYEFFEYNIAYEIRLHQAMKEDLLCPFHYFGVSDVIINGIPVDDKTSINILTSDTRVKHILNKSDYYGYSGDKLHGLIFVSNISEAKILADKFKKYGRKAISLSSENSDFEREEAIKKLENGDIEFIISVDIFNEGVDIPCVNQVLLLRPTLSSIIYIQQLGRGLRKSPNKDFTIILDFIGNYDKNFLIPIAISQNSSYDKDYMKRFLMNGTNILPGESSINFDEISREKIFSNINFSNFSNKKLIENDFSFLEKQLGRIPMLTDFFDKNMVEPSIILKYRKNYDDILKLLRPELNLPRLLKFEKDYLNFLSSFFSPAKRIHEIIILKEFLKNNKLSPTIENIEKILKNKYNLLFQNENIKNAYKHLSKEIFTNLSQLKLYPKIIEHKNNSYFLCETLKKSYFNNTYFKLLIDDLIEYNLKYCLKNYKQKSEKTLKLYGEYSKQEAFWYANLDFNNAYQVSGYTAFNMEKKLMIFITMVNSDARNIYNNVFYDSQTFNWFSKSNRYLKKNNEDTTEGKIAKNFYEISIFIKKVNGENFYYVGEVADILEVKEIRDYQNKPMIEYIFRLKYEIEKNLFNYLNL